MKQTYSENLAKLFEIVDYLLLIPVLCIGVLYFIPVLLYGGLFAFAYLFSEHYIFGVTFFAICFAVFAIFAFGVRLMIGYSRHSRGELNKNKVDKLWISTICFNAIFFFPSLYLNLQCWLTEKYCLESFSNSHNELKILSEFSIIFILLTVWWGIATILPFTAMLSTETGENDGWFFYTDEKNGKTFQVFRLHLRFEQNFISSLNLNRLNLRFLQLAWTI